MACHPKYSARQRIVVEAVLVGQPGAVDPPGRRRRRRPSCPTTAWPAAIPPPAARRSCGRSSRSLIWFAAWYLSKRRLHGWWRVAPYVVLIPFFAMALYASFENITRLLPGAY